MQNTIHSLEDLFAVNNFQIPQYQRAYSWEEDRDTVKQSVRDHYEFPADFYKHARFQNSRQLAFCARLGIADFLIENNDGILRIETHIALDRKSTRLNSS